MQVNEIVDRKHDYCPPSRAQAISQERENDVGPGTAHFLPGDADHECNVYSKGGLH